MGASPPQSPPSLDAFGDLISAPHFREPSPNFFNLHILYTAPYEVVISGTRQSTRTFQGPGPQKNFRLESPLDAFRLSLGIHQNCKTINLTLPLTTAYVIRLHAN